MPHFRRNTFESKLFNGPLNTNWIQNVKVSPKRQFKKLGMVLWRKVEPEERLKRRARISPSSSPKALVYFSAFSKYITGKEKCQELIFCKPKELVGKDN